jgi:Protein of unknown function (DUF3618)
VASHPGDRDADAIQQEIEQARVSLASAVDQITYRTNPKRVSENIKQTLVQKAQTPVGIAVIGTTGALLVFLIVRRIRKD